MNEQNEIWQSEYELRQFIDIAIRYDIEAIYSNRTEKHPYSSIFSFYVNNARSNYELFRTQLREKLGKIDNWNAIKIDVEDRFFPMIEQYILWFEKNKKEVEKFEPNNPYKFMYEIIQSTKNEILKYFGNDSKNNLKTPFKDQKTAELFEYIVQKWNYPNNQKWADIWDEINESDNYKAPYKNEYQTYIIKRFEYTGRFQYDKLKDPQNRDRIELIELIKNFSKK